MVDISKITLTTGSFFDLTADLSLIEKVTGINFTNPDDILFETKESYLESVTEDARIISMFEFAEQTKDKELKKFLNEKYAEKLASLFNE